MTTARLAGESNGDTNRSSTNNRLNPKGNPMKPMFTYRDRLLFRRSDKPNRILRIRPAKLNFIFRPVRFGLKPKITEYECK
jgi:hypothetical protein